MTSRKSDGTRSPKFRFPRQRAIKLRFRRQLRLQKRQVEEFGAQAEQRLEEDFFKRLERLTRVRRFVISWVLLLVLVSGVVVAQTRSLSGYYQVPAPAPGGTYTEGVLGSFTNASPIYATGLTNSTVSELIFAGLLAYDSKNQLVGDLAESWTVAADNRTYTVKLRPGLTWHDGRALTSKDVVFTYKVIQSPDARSPLFNSWSNIEVSAQDDSTITFALPNPLASFPHSLTTGIIPEHILGNVPMANMRSVSFNSTQPVGAGPFKWQAIELVGESADNRHERIALRAFDNYHAGKPKLNGFIIRTFTDPDRMAESFKRQEINAIAGLNRLPDSLSGEAGARVNSLPLTAGVMAFFRTGEGVLADKNIRRALVAGADRKGIIDSLQYSTIPVRQALLRGQLGYDKRYDQSGHDASEAARLLDEAGWTAGQGGIRHKDGQPLSFTLYYLDNQEYSIVANKLAEQWKKIGVQAKLMPQRETDFGAVLANAPSPGSPSYDVLLYGISIGVDPDVYIYWHSSQVDPLSPVRLNFSEYQSSVADESLEGGRTRLDPELRAAKYQPFLEAWKADAPALGLYQPRFLYITRGAVHGLEETPINTDSGRFWNVHNWMIREEWVTPQQE